MEVAHPNPTATFHLPTYTNLRCRTALQPNHPISAKESTQSPTVEQPGHPLPKRSTEHENNIHPIHQSNPSPSPPQKKTTIQNQNQTPFYPSLRKQPKIKKTHTLPDKNSKKILPFPKGRRRASTTLPPYTTKRQPVQFPGTEKDKLSKRQAVPSNVGGCGGVCCCCVWIFVCFGG